MPAHCMPNEHSGLPQRNLPNFYHSCMLQLSPGTSTPFVRTTFVLPAAPPPPPVVQPAATANGSQAQPAASPPPAQVIPPASATTNSWGSIVGGHRRSVLAARSLQQVTIAGPSGSMPVLMPQPANSQAFLPPCAVQRPCSAAQVRGVVCLLSGCVFEAVHIHSPQSLSCPVLQVASNYLEQGAAAAYAQRHACLVLQGANNKNWVPRLLLFCRGALCGSLLCGHSQHHRHCQL